jgi:hypothetical protein
MQLFNYLKGLFHRITRGQIQASCDAVTDNLQKHTIVGYTQASDLFKTRKLSSPEAKEMISQYTKTVGSLRNGDTLIDGIKTILENTVTLLTQISEKSQTVFSDVESTLGMTFQKAMYLRLISAATFVNDYAPRLLDYLYVVETAHLDPQGSPLENALTGAQREWITANYGNFCIVLSILKNDAAEVIKQVDELPDAVVSEHSEHSLAGASGKQRIDPFGFHGLALPMHVSVKWNPFYLVGQLIADFRTAQYKETKSQLELLQLRKLNLEKIHDKKPDARLQQEIEYLADRVATMQFELSEMENKHG